MNSKYIDIIKVALEEGVSITASIRKAESGWDIRYTDEAGNPIEDGVYLNADSVGEAFENAYHGSAASVPSVIEVSYPSELTANTFCWLAEYDEDTDSVSKIAFD